MAISTQYTIGAVVFSGSPAFNLDGITEFFVDPSVSLSIQQAGGQVDPTHVSVISQAPVCRFVCNDIATALTNIGISGLPIKSGATTSCDFYFTKMDAYGTRSSGAVNGRVRLVAALVVPKQVSVSHGEAATYSFDVMAIYDGTNNPFQYSFTTSLPHTPSIDELFTMGPISINGTTLYGCKQLTIDFGLSVSAVSSCGEVFPTFVGIDNRGPSIEIQTVEVPYLNTFGLSGTAQASTDSVIYLRKISENSTRVADVTQEHISFTIDDGIITVGEFGGSNGAASGGTIRITPSFDGTNAIMVINPATAIT